MRTLFLPVVVCTLWLMFTGSAAADTVYQVDETVGPGSVMGTITTDGIQGPLFTVDIVSFDLTLFDGTNTATLASGVNGGSVFIGSGALVANGDFLNFSGVSGAFVNFFTAPSTTACTPLWTLRVGGGSTCAGPSVAGSVLPISGNVNAIAASLTTMASAPLTPGNSFVVGVVPEPGSFGMIVAGLVGILGFRKLRF